MGPKQLRLLPLRKVPLGSWPEDQMLSHQCRGRELDREKPAQRPEGFSFNLGEGVGVNGGPELPTFDPQLPGPHTLKDTQISAFLLISQGAPQGVSNLSG